MKPAKPRIKKIKVLKVKSPEPDHHVVALELEVEGTHELPPVEVPHEIEPEHSTDSAWLKWLKSVW